MEEIKWHSCEVNEVIKKSETDIHSGLSEAEVKKRQEIYGYNELKKEEKVSPFVVFLNQFKNILIIILLVATLLSALVGEIFDALLILGIIIFCAVLGFVQEYKAEKAIEALKKMLSPMITALRDGREQEVPSKELVPGDILLLEAGDKIPADARLVEVASLKCDEAPLTGESIPVGKVVSPLPGEVRVSDRKNMVFTGTTVIYGRAKAVVTSTGINTEFGRIAEEVRATEVKKTPLEKRTEEIGKWLGIISLSICVLITGISIIQEAMIGSINLSFVIKMVMFAVALAVAAVPEALAAIVTGTLSIGMHQMAKKNALIRKMPAVETLGCTTVICSDKTGTLTKGEMTVRRIFVSGRNIEVTGVGYKPRGELKGFSQAEASGDKTLDLLLTAGVLCNDASLGEVEGKWMIKGDPTEGALIVTAAKKGLHTSELRVENPRVEEIPFSSERKRMTTIHRMEDGNHFAFMKGAAEVVLERCTCIMENGWVREFGSLEKAEILKVNEQMANSALRVLGFAYRELEGGEEYKEEKAEGNMVFLGLMGMIDPPREEAIEAIKVCLRVKIKPIMITGDHKLTAVAIASEIGIYNEGDIVLTGDELEKLSDDEFADIVHKVTVYARVSPLDKLKIVNAWKRRGEVVAMTGDGVNDAPALKQADIGVAMGITGTDVAKEASDMVLNDDNFATIVSAIEIGRWIYDNIKKYLTYLLQCNITEVVVIGGAVLAAGPEYLPLLPAAILYINLATDGVPALALGVAPPDPDIMERPPRNPNESIFSLEVLSFILMALFLWSPFFLYYFFHDHSDIVHARTRMFFLFIIIELLVALNSRSLKFSIFKLRPHRWLVLSVVSQLVLTAIILFIPSVMNAFSIRRPTWGDLDSILCFGAFVFLSMELIKIYLRKKA